MALFLCHVTARLLSVTSCTTIANTAARSVKPHIRRHGSDVVLETKVLVSRRLEDKNTSLGLGLGLDKKFLSIFKPFSSLMMIENYDIVV